VWLALVLLGYACGAVPWGLVLARRASVDVRRTGSGNIGAANVARTAGPLLGVATLAADVAKGALPVLVARRLGADAATEAVVGLAAFAGHVFPVTLGFNGGKGVATALGALAALAPYAALGGLSAFVAVFAVCRFVSVASLVGAVVAGLVAAALGASAPVVVTALAMAAVIVARHRDNLARLRAGTEPRFSLHRKQAPPAP
jgi:glycerol-3-phosphate acyltransferase PlsY